MLKRITLFILAHIAFFGIAAAIVVASTGEADAQQQLDQRVCEVDAGGTIGFVAGEALRVQ